MKYLVRFNESQEEANSVKQWRIEFKDFCEGGLAFILDEANIEYNFNHWDATDTNVCSVEIHLDEPKDWVEIRDYFIPFFQRLNSNYFISGPIEISTKIADRVASIRNYSYKEVISGEIEPAATKRSPGSGYVPKNWSQKDDPMARFIDPKYMKKSVVTVIRFKALSAEVGTSNVDESMTYDEKYDEVLDRCLDLIDLGYDFTLNDGEQSTVAYDFRDKVMLASFNKSEKVNVEDNQDVMSDIATNYKAGTLYVYDNGNCVPSAYDGLSKSDLLRIKERKELLEVVTDCLFRLKTKFNNVMGCIRFSNTVVRDPQDFSISFIVMLSEVRFYVSKSNPLITESKEDKHLDLQEYCESNLAFLIDEGYKINFSALYSYDPEIGGLLISIRKPSGNLVHETFTWSDVKDELIRFAYLINKEYELEVFSTKEFRILLPKEIRGTRTTTPTIDLSYDDLEKLEDSFKLTAFCVKVKL